MKQSYRRNLFSLPLLATALASGVAVAGPEETVMMPAPAPVEAPVDDVVSGVLNLNFNSHFISYGLDVWRDGSSMSDPTFNPSLELKFDLPSEFTFVLGTWWDVNSKAGGNNSPLGGRIQEVDTYYGLSYAFEKLTVGVTYQNWMYGSETEDILDVTFAFNTFLSPSLTVHTRLDEGASGGNTGTVLVLGLSHGFELGPVSVTPAFNIAYFLEDDFHGGTDNGFGYASLGVGASLPLSPYIGDSFGDWTLNGGLTYYITDDEVIPSNPTDSFLTASLGVSLAF